MKRKEINMEIRINRTGSKQLKEVVENNQKDGW